jgi:hypothetical protein
MEKFQDTRYHPTIDYTKVQLALYIAVLIFGVFNIVQMNCLWRLCILLVESAVNDPVIRVIDLDITLIDGNLVSVAKDSCNFFQREAFGIREEEEHDESTNGSRDNETQVEFPPDFTMIDQRSATNGLCGRLTQMLLARLEARRC